MLYVVTGFFTGILGGLFGVGGGEIFIPFRIFAALGPGYVASGSPPADWSLGGASLLPGRLR